MSWEAFRELYREQHLFQLRQKSQEAAESRLDIATRILRPRTLGDVANADALSRLLAELLRGAESRYGRPRSPHSVKAYLVNVKAALNFAVGMEWLPSAPKVPMPKVSKLRHAKGRPLSLEEFERMLLATERIVGAHAAESWQYLLRGLWESGLRLGEALCLSWSDEAQIRPVWQRGRLPVLQIPAALQKNDTEESIPMLPAFEQLLLETPEAEWQGWVFRPASLEPNGRQRRRPTTTWVGKIAGRIGAAAGVVVRSDGRTKTATAHDLRRGLAERLYDAGIPERVVMQVMRHASPQTTRRYYAPADTQKAAGILRERLGAEPVGSPDVPRYIATVEST
jgi:integrase